MARLIYENNTTEQDDRDLYHIALQCELNRQSGCCVNYTCQTCKYNIVHYTPSMAKVGMLKATASINASHTISNWNASGIAFFVSIALIIGIVLACFFGLKSCIGSLKDYNATVPQDTIPIERIEDTLKLTHENIKDVNKDGLVNCIDYAYLFKKYYGYHARIIRNVNKETGMDHLLNAVQFTDRDPISKWIFVEPQGDKYTWRPDTYWGSKYDHEYDYDETWKWYQ